MSDTTGPGTLTLAGLPEGWHPVNAVLVIECIDTTSVVHIHGHGGSTVLEWVDEDAA